MKKMFILCMLVFSTLSYAKIPADTYKEAMEMVTMCRKQIVNAAFEQAQYGSRKDAYVELLAASIDDRSNLLVEVDFTDSETQRMLVHLSVEDSKCDIVLVHDFAMDL